MRILDDITARFPVYYVHLYYYNQFVMYIYNWCLVFCTEWWWQKVWEQSEYSAAFCCFFSSSCIKNWFPVKLNSWTFQCTGTKSARNSCPSACKAVTFTCFIYTWRLFSIFSFCTPFGCIAININCGHTLYRVEQWLKLIDMFNSSFMFY